MRVSTASLVLAIVGLTITVGAADPRYVGTWKLNVAKGLSGESMLTFETLRDGSIRATEDGLSYTFKVDGRDYPTPWSVTAAWTVINANTWSRMLKSDGKPMVSARLTLSADGKTLTVDSKMVEPKGQATSQTAVYQRVSGGPSLSGKWKTRDVAAAAASLLRITAKGTDGVILVAVQEQEQITCDARLDGKDHRVSGRFFTGWTCSVARSGKDGLVVTWKVDGKIVYTDTLIPSADGKTLNNVTSAVASGEKVSMVYERQ